MDSSSSKNCRKQTCVRHTNVFMAQPMEHVTWMSQNMSEQIVHLVLKHKWFDMISSGKKRTEYRDDSDFWRKRIFRKEVVVFHRGYTTETMSFKIKEIESGKGTIKICLGKKTKRVKKSEKDACMF